jgi:murein DD-endopeptidase MepM/ murein hydrolase activator NlpD
MLRLAVLIGLLAGAAWSAREAGWFNVRLPVTTPHESYEQSLVRTGLLDTTLGRRWMEASQAALTATISVDLPNTHTLEFDVTRPVAWGYRMSLKRGQRLEVTTTIESDAPAEAFIDVFEPSAKGGTPDHQVGALRGVGHEADEDQELVVRLQPELLRAGRLTITFRAAPAFAFPVADALPSHVQSIFGDPRDAGRRSHEGVDIFAKRGTPVLSATDGVVMRVGENRLGGNVVWVWDTKRGLRLYYAHLTEQLVTTGQHVKARDVLGTVGNTGNARTTAPHLHFGIYESGTGALDPYWFIAPPADRGGTRATGNSK